MTSQVDIVNKFELQFLIIESIAGPFYNIIKVMMKGPKNNKNFQTYNEFTYYQYLLVIDIITYIS